MLGLVDLPLMGEKVDIDEPKKYPFLLAAFFISYVYTHIL